MNPLKQLGTLIKKYGFILVIVLYYALLDRLGIGCPIKYFTGVSCPGCGMTRAYIALFHLNIPLAFHYHPLFWMVPVLFYAIWGRRGPFSSIKFRNAVLIILVLLFFMVYFLRLFVFKNDIVTVNRPGI